MMNLETAIKDLGTLEVMLASIEEPTVHGRFHEVIMELYMDIYDNHIDAAERVEIDRGIRLFELEQDGWEHDEDIQQENGWLARVFQHAVWDRWLVEFYGPTGRMEEWDGHFDSGAEAKQYAARWVRSSNRPWG